MPSTIIRNGIVLQKTQKKLSFKHVHLTKNNYISLDCDILAIESTELCHSNLVMLQQLFAGTIVWGDNILENLYTFLNETATDDDTPYLYIMMDGYSKQYIRHANEIIEDSQLGLPDKGEYSNVFEFKDFLKDFEPEKVNLDQGCEINEISYEDYIGGKLLELDSDDKKIENILKRINLFKK